MFIWWQRIWNRDSQQQHKFLTNALRQSTGHLNDSCRTASPSTHHHDHLHQLPYSVHHNCKSQTKCIRKSLTDHSSRMNSFCSVILLIHCFNVFVLAIASENLSNSQPQPCDRSRRVFTDMQGEISNGPPGYNYTQDSHCEWLVKAKNDSQFITLKFHSLATECSYDYVFVFDGDSYKSPLLGSFSGKTEPQQVVATSGSMLILLYSDTNYVLNGFQAEYFISNCPNNCSNRGKCVGHQCVCKGDWIAKDCSIHACPDSCGVNEGRGICSKEHCRCKNGYSGKSCSLHIENNVGNEWHYLASAYSGLTARAAHSAIYVRQTDSLYVYGGHDLNNVLGALQIYRFNKSQWEDELGISLRSRHFPAEWDNTLLKAILHQNEEEARLWGLKSDASFFRNILLSISDENFLRRRQRSPKRSLKIPLNLNESLTNTEISEFLEELSEKSHVGPMHRYGHAACPINVEGGGFVISGGKLEDGRLSNDLWMFNASAQQPEDSWILRATNSTFRPPPLTRHTITLAGDYLYVFGGSLSNGQFSSRLFRIKLMSDPNADQWEEIHARGGKSLDVRVVAHTTIYHEATNSLIVYGGVVVNVARFSKLSDRMFIFHLDELHWTEMHYPRMQLRDAYIPRERAFHTADVVGNYMVVFGGYTHRHNKEEICYDNQMYLYHLRCHTWINSDVLGMNPAQRYPKKQGVFAHAAAVRNDNTLLIVGGYHGNVNADLLAYTLPAMLQVKRNEPFDPENYCHKHTAISECLSDLDCGWCSTDNVCYGRTQGGANCTANLQTTWCPGICVGLHSCHSCLIHGNEKTSSEARVRSFASKFGLNQCQWCVQNARCHHKDNYGTCGSGDDTPSQEMGWWGPNGAEIDSAKQCSLLDRRPGLTFLNYYSPVNLTMPDKVSFINATMVDFMTPPPTTKTEHEIHGDIVARLYGFIRPPKKWLKSSEQWHMCASNSKTILNMSNVLSNFDDFRTMANLSVSRSQCQLINWTDVIARDSADFANETILTERILIDLQSNRSLFMSGTTHPNFYHAPSKIALQHNGTHDSSAFTFEYLETYSKGNCGSLTNCLQCLSDSLCGWCDVTNECVLRSMDEKLCSRSDNATDWKYFIIEPTQCTNCSDFITCDQCIESNICEWWTEDARCERYGRFENAIRNVEQCPAPCHTRDSCSSCLEDTGRCVWCFTTSTCFSFSVYTSEFQFGLCHEWIDQAIPLGEAKELPKQKCKSCESHTNCSTCLQNLNCGWCFDRDNPIEGKCLQGDFNSSAQSCDDVLHSSGMTKIVPGETEWAYAQCPDVDECGLGLHDCHPEAKCTNTHGSYNCYCRRGFIGDGRTSCVRTCYEQCVNGYCSGAPDYKCICDIGWTGESCQISCGCNNHSTCVNGPGYCDQCEHWTEGDSCERCRAGSFGNATSLEKKCRPCECNGHGNDALGICDIQTGECFCEHNTEGNNCEKCSANYYGNPINGGQCFFHCESRGMLKNVGLQGIGSYQSQKNNFGPEIRECLWIVSPHASSGTQLIDNFIQFEIIRDSSFKVSCNENAVYVYDGLPDLIGHTQQRQLLSVFCTEDTKYYMVEARSGHLTVHYKHSVKGQGFNAVYSVQSCAAGTCTPPRVCRDGKCSCADGFTGADCSIQRCPRNCSEELDQGKCDKSYGRCLCNKEFGGKDCSIPLKYEKSVIFTELFNSLLIDDSLEHLRKTLPRFGHSLVSDKRGNLWMFAGYSLHHQALNDIRQFDTRNSSWMQVTVDSTPDAKMPVGRYFHGADMQHSKQNIFIYGGMTGMTGMPHNNGSETVLNDFWKFSVTNQRWREVEVGSDMRPPPLTGHTLTLVKDGDHDILVLIGGFSPMKGFSHHTYAFNLTTTQWAIFDTIGQSPIGVYGHSAVYHAPSQSVYVFGGYVFQSNDKIEMSNKLYALNVGQRFWSEIPIFSGINHPEDNLPRARFLHSAISTDKYMLIYGGRTQPENSSDSLIAYVYKCNMWVRLTENIELVGQLKPSYAHGMAYDSDAVYIVTGWDGSIISRVIRINVPNDLCELFSSSKHLCRHFMGCSFCTVKPNDMPVSHCYANDRTDICTENEKQYNKGIPCDASAINGRICSTFTSCESCTAVYPYFAETISPCRWCGDSNTGRCVPSNSTQYYADDAMIISTGNACPGSFCNGDCDICMERGCHWIQEENKNSYCSSEEVHSETKQESHICPRRCESFKNCTECLSASDENEGGCRWSSALNQCLSPNYQNLWCVGGVCGLVLQSSEIAYCPEPCSAYTQCHTCLAHAHCGWCSKSNTEGEGVCTEGSLESPSEYPAASTCDIIYANQKNLTIGPHDEIVWNYVKCPPENECINGHHNCDSKSERCMDRMVGYECECADGFEPLSTSKGTNISIVDTKKTCIPKCTQGCVRGRCVEPNKCECDFGYVGANCSIQCLCNGHSNCKGPDQLDICLECRNNTVGNQCEKCAPLFVGDARDNGECVACSDYCYGHTELCVERDSNSTVRNMNKNELLETLTHGPERDALCLRCHNQTTDERCQGCIFGHFRGAEDFRLPCRRCHCQGHGDQCDPVTGEKCNCGNNTESDTTCTSNRNSAHQCWMLQCSKCRESYAGNPIDGHQCYKQITVESKMCFDAKTIDECKKPQPLKNGHTTFFVVQPRFMNVDIRIIVDVTSGELNLFMSPQEDALVVETSSESSHHNVYFDSKYTWFADYNSELIEPISIARKSSSIFASHPFEGNFSFPNNRRFLPDVTHDCSPSNLNSLFVKDVHAKELSTYVTLNKCNTMLRVYNLKNRLVITLPQHTHNLSTTRFYIALRATNGAASYGLIFFRQDQLHIDLFVFFSVFFSCFFLFLAVCVVVWKAKQAADVRRARLRHVVEMLHMARRPFASVQLSIVNTGTPQPHTRRALRVNNLKHTNVGIRPIAIEPVADNAAAVCTVFVRLPGAGKAPTISLASALVVFSARQFPAYQRIPYIRRRRISSNAVPNQNPTPGPSSPSNQRPLATIQLRRERNLNINQVI